MLLKFLSKSPVTSLSFVVLGFIFSVPMLGLMLGVIDPLPAVAQASVPIDVRQAYTLLGQGLVDQAIAQFQSAIQRYPNSVEAKLGLAIAYRRAGKDENAFETYQSLLAQDPNNVLALRSVGLLGGYKTEWQKKGIEALTQLLGLNPSDTEARAQRALLYGYQGKFAESVSDYDRVLKGGTPTPEVLLGAAQIYTYNGNPRRGLELFEQYRSSTQKEIPNRATIAYAKALRATGNPAQAVAILEAQLPNKTSGVAARSELAQAYLANRQPAQALSTLAPLRNRSDTESRLALARALNEIGRQGRPDLQAESAALYQQALAMTPNPSSALVKEAADVLSGIPGQEQIALTLFRQLAAQNPTDKVILIQQLALEGKLGTMPAGAIVQQVRAILTPFPTDPAQQGAIAAAIARLDPDPEYFPIYQSLLQSGVNEPFLHFRMAQLFIDRNDFINARTALAVYKATPAGAQDLAPDLLMAEVDRKEGNLEVAAGRYAALLNSGTTDADVINSALRGLAGIRLSQNRAGEALYLYDQLLVRNPNDGVTRLGRTAIAYQAKLITEFDADAAINQFLQSRPAQTPTELYTLVGLLPAQAYREPLYIALANANPTNIDVQVRLIQVIAKRDPFQAQIMANRILAQIKGGTAISALSLRGRLAEALGNLDQADQAYIAILNFQPDNLEAISALGGIRFQQRQFDSAERLYLLALAMKPENSSTIQRTLADLSSAAGKPLQALDRLEALKIQQQATPGSVPDLSLQQRQQEIQEGFLQQRGFQPTWERY
jgi:cellulose synthase operon protein C